jgi:hypothetical protein
MKVSYFNMKYIDFYMKVSYFYLKVSNLTFHFPYVELKVMKWKIVDDSFLSLHIGPEKEAFVVLPTSYSSKSFDLICRSNECTFKHIL